MDLYLNIVFKSRSILPTKRYRLLIMITLLIRNQSVPAATFIPFFMSLQILSTAILKSLPFPNSEPNNIFWTERNAVIYASYRILYQVFTACPKLCEMQCLEGTLSAKRTDNPHLIITQGMKTRFTLFKSVPRYFGIPFRVRKLFFSANLCILFDSHTFRSSLLFIKGEDATTSLVLLLIH